jgi:hypothetical protein
MDFPVERELHDIYRDRNWHTPSHVCAVEVGIVGTVTRDFDPRRTSSVANVL